MNENFRFLASEIREKSVYCNNGETISDAINAGYNFLTIYGTCDGAIMVYKFDPSPFGINFSDMSNKSISHLIIKGGDADRAATIKNTAGGMHSMVMSGGFLQLDNVTFNDKLKVSFGSVLMANEVNYEVLNGESAKLGVYGTSYISLNNTSISAEVQISTGSVANIESSTINGQVDIWMGASCEIEESTINGTISIRYQSVARLEDTTLNGDGGNNRTLKITHNSHAGLTGTTSINGFAGEDQTVWLWNNSTIEIQDTSTVSAPSGARAIGIQQNSAAILSDNPTINSIDETTITLDTNGSLEINDNTQISRTDDASNTEINVDDTSSVNINSNSSWDGDVSCGGITSHVDTGGSTSVSIGSTCNGYENLQTEQNMIVMYLTTNTYDGNLGGRSGANEKCQSDHYYTVAREIAPNCNVLAYLSISENDKITNLIQNYGIDGSKKVVGPFKEYLHESFSQFNSGNGNFGKPLYHETQTHWTGSSSNGELSNNCSGFTSNQQTSYTYYGRFGGSTTSVNGDGQGTCNILSNILCLCH